MAGRPDRDSDHAPLLGGDASSRHDQRKHEGSASVMSCFSNLANTILGTGMLAMAHAFSAAGLIPGMVTVLFCGGSAYLGLVLLAKCAAHPSVPHRGASFAALSALTYPSAGVFFDLAIAVKCFGVSISYLIIFGALMPQVVLSFGRAGSTPIPEILLDRRLWITVAMLFLVPLSFLRKLDSLRYTSYIALVAVADLVIVVVYKYFDRSGLEPPGDIYLVHISPSFLAALPVYIFAYTCAQNLFAVHNELSNNTEQRVKMVLKSALGSAAIIYEVVGVLGYLTFGANVSSNIISDYHNSPFIAVCRLAISILVLFSYPLQLHPCRASLDKFLAFRNKKQSDDDYHEDDHASQEMPMAKYVLLTSGLLLGTFVIAINVQRLETVLGFVGSTGSTTISFILPSLFYIRLFEPSSSTILRKLAFCLLVWGCLVFVVCLSLNTVEAIKPGMIAKLSITSGAVLGGV